jgi:hypothetical protein
VIRPIELISPGYLDAQKAMHANPKGYGGRGYTWAPTVIEIAQRYNVGSILDYGAGQGTLGSALRDAGWTCRDYDPAIPGWDAPPVFADMVTCTDVMEHIERDRLDTVFRHIRMLARTVVFFVIATRAANKLLPDGHNAHLTIMGGKWWRDRVLAAGFTLQDPPTVLPAKLPGKCWYGVVTP